VYQDLERAKKIENLKFTAAGPAIFRHILEDYSLCATNMCTVFLCNKCTNFTNLFCHETLHV